MTQEKNTVEKVVEAESRAFSEYQEALRAAQSTKALRKGKIDEALMEYKQKIVRLNEQKKQAGDDLANALMDSDTEKAAEIRGMISGIEEEIRDTEANIETLSGHNSAHAEGELVDVAVEKYLAAVKAGQEAAQALAAESDRILKEIDRLKERLKEIGGQTGQINGRFGRGTALKKHEEQLVALYEGAKGPIDVKGHTAGSDNVAKLRFITGKPRGIENTPAMSKRGAQS